MKGTRFYGFHFKNLSLLLRACPFQWVLLVTIAYSKIARLVWQSPNHEGQPFPRLAILKINFMLTDKETALINEMALVLAKHGYVGFAGTFRDRLSGTFTTIKIEDPLFHDGSCIALGKVLEHYTMLLGFGYGEWDNLYSGGWPAPGKDPNEMPH